MKRQINAELEGKCLPKYGLVIFIMDISDEDIVPGLIDNDTGAVIVSCMPTIVFLRPFKNEVLDAIVSSASNEHGFHCQVGPLPIFVSYLQMPDDIKFYHITGDCWKSEDETIEIRNGSKVRLRIIGTSAPEDTELYATGSIKEACLGLLEED